MNLSSTFPSFSKHEFCLSLGPPNAHIFAERVPVLPGYDERQNCKIERRKRNLKFFSPVSRGERETGNSFLQFREEKEKSKKIFSTFERRKRKGYSILKLQEEKEKVKTNCSMFEKRNKAVGIGETLPPSSDMLTRSSLLDSVISVPLSKSSMFHILEAPAFRKYVPHDGPLFKKNNNKNKNGDLT